MSEKRVAPYGKLSNFFLENTTCLLCMLWVPPAETSSNDNHNKL